MHPSGGGYLPPVTPGDGYQLRLSPECLIDNINHWPIIHRLQHGLLSIKTQQDTSGTQGGPSENYSLAHFKVLCPRPNKSPQQLQGDLRALSGLWSGTVQLRDSDT
jgi:hypothetical protein